MNTDTVRHLQLAAGHLARAAETLVPPGARGHLVAIRREARALLAECLLPDAPASGPAPRPSRRIDIEE